MAFAAEMGVAPDRCYLAYKTMFEEEAKREDGIESISIATPNGMHCTVCKAALESGLHAVCEKPLCRRNAGGGQWRIWRFLVSERRGGRTGRKMDRKVCRIGR